MISTPDAAEMWVAATTEGGRFASRRLGAPLRNVAPRATLPSRWGGAQHCLRRARTISIPPPDLSQVQISATFRSEHSGSEHSGRMAMNRMVAGLGCALVLLVGGANANAQGTVKIGLINVLSGQFADAGIQLDNGVKTYMKQHGDTVAGKKIEIIRRDV